MSLTTNLWRNHVVTYRSSPLGPQPTMVASSPRPYPSFARPVFHAVSSKEVPVQLLAGAAPVSRYCHVDPVATSVTELRSKGKATKSHPDAFGPTVSGLSKPEFMRL